MSLSSRLGWCPGALRPMRSGDGLLVRVKPRGGALSLDQADGVARLAAACGSGQIDLTGRANLQIRGVSAATIDDLTAGLGELGLLDADAEVEAVRNIVASPLAGLDPEAVDIKPVVAALEARLAADPACRLLPPKWSIVVDDGGRLSLDTIAADIRVRVAEPGIAWLGLSDRAWAMMPIATLADTLSTLASFSAKHGGARMRDLLPTVGAGPLFAAIGAPQVPPPPRRAAVIGDDLLGDPHDGLFVGVAPSLGSLGALDLQGIAAAARRAGAYDLRLTPWRVLLVTFAGRLSTEAHPRRTTMDSPLPCGEGLGVRVAQLRVASPAPSVVPTLTPDPSPQGRGECAAAAAIEPKGGAPAANPAADRLARELGALGHITDGTDPRLKTVACTGAPGCHRATTSTRADAAALARHIGCGKGIMIHVSGCAKGCARPGATAWTLVGREGRYDLVRNGTAQDTPLAQGLSFKAAAAWVRGAMQVATP